MTVPEATLPEATVPEPKSISIPHFRAYEIYPPAHLLVTADVTGTAKYVNLSLLATVRSQLITRSIVVVNLFHMPEEMPEGMSEGIPYFRDRQEIWSHDTGKEVSRVTLQLTSRRLAVITYFDRTESLGNLGVFFLNWRTGDTYLVSHSISLLKVNETHGTDHKSTEIHNRNASFIDEYRFLGLVRSEHKDALMLWDTSHKSPSRVELEFDEGVFPTLDVAPRNYESTSNRERPFHEDPSKGIVCLKVSGHRSGNMFVVPVEALVSLSLSNTAQQGQVSWEKWENRVTVLSLHSMSRLYKVLHSQVVCVSKRVEDGMVIPVLHVYDFSCRPVKVEVAGGNTTYGPLRLPESHSQFTTREITLGDNIPYINYGFQITERGVHADPIPVS